MDGDALKPIWIGTLVCLPLLLGTAPGNIAFGAGNTGSNSSYLFGCTQYVPLYHCDPILNDFESYSAKAEFSKVLSLTRDASYENGLDGRAVMMNAHALESIRMDNTPAYQSKEFTLMISIKPNEDEAGGGYSNLVTYRNGIFTNDWHNAGWELSFRPTDDESVRKVRFTVYGSDGSANSPIDATIPINKFTKIAASFDGRQVKLYIDSVLFSQANFTQTYLPNPGQNIKLAGDSYCSCYLTSATFDNFRLYNRALSNQEIAEGTSPSGLVGQWNFDGNLVDSSTQANDAFYNTNLGHMAFAGDGRLFFTEKNTGKIRIIKDGQLVSEPFATIPSIQVNWEQGLLGLTLDSKFDQNRYVYVYHNYKDQSSGNIYARVVRFTDVNDIGKNKTILLDQIPASSQGYHTGGALAFNPVDDNLYITVGDSNNGATAQDKQTLNGKILRISRDGLIPADNPFGSEVYNYGHRNMYGIGFNPEGQGIISEASESLYDEINYLVKGGNNGWPTIQLPNTPPELSNDSVKPIRSYFQTLNPTQIVYYDSDRHPELKGSFLVGAFRGYIYSYKIDSSGQLISELKIDTNVYPSSEVVGVAVSPSGEIYFGFYDIYKLDSISFADKVQTMFSVQVDASKMQVSSLSFDPAKRNVVAELNDQPGNSALSLRIANSMIGPITGELSHESENALADDGKTEVSLPYRVTANEKDGYSTVDFEFFDDYASSDKLKVIMSVSSLQATKTIPEFPLPLILLGSVLAIFLGLVRIKGWPSDLRK